MNRSEASVRPLYMELRASGVDLRVQDPPNGRPLDYGIGADLSKLPEARATAISMRIRENEDALIDLLLDHENPDLRAIRAEFNIRP